MKYEVNFNNYFSNEEKEKVLDYVSENFDELELKKGMNYGVDVSDAIGRTSNVDVEVF